MELNHIGKGDFSKKITLTGSKSESNRLVILQQFFSNLVLQNLSNANDTLVLQKALASTKNTINIGHAGTAMRFLTAYFACKKGSEIVLTGSDRMQQRPIKILVEALQNLGANITYINKEGYPPLKIKGTQLISNQIPINGNVSSQYITALLLIAPSLPSGLKLILKGTITSKPYIEMTLALLHKIGVTTTWLGNEINVQPTNKIENQELVIESDWSAASYFYSLVALSENGKIVLSSFKKNSLQGDSALADIYLKMGVTTVFNNNLIELSKTADFKQKKHVIFNLINTPDIAQTIAVTCFGLGISCGLTGLHTLKIKETDRLEALKIELKKLGAKVRTTKDSFHMVIKENKKQEVKSKKELDMNLKTSNSKFKIQNLSTLPIIETYNDHRMAMSFAPLSLRLPITIKNASVVEKSYPNFWKDLASVFKTKN